MEQPKLLRDYKYYESLLGAAAPTLWGLPPGIFQPDALPGAGRTNETLAARPPQTCGGRWACCASYGQCCGCCKVSPSRAKGYRNCNAADGSWRNGSS